MLLKKNIPIKYIFGKISVEMIVLSVYVSAVVFAQHYFNLKHISIPVSVPMIMGTVISLLLAFRSNQAYDRWWEARTVWGAIVNDSRSFARQVNTYLKESIPMDEVFRFKEKCIKRQIAWCYSLSHHLRGSDAMKGIERHVSRKDVQQLKNYNNVPMALLELHGHDIQQAADNGWINQYQQVELDRTLTRLCDAMGKCERIKNTVFPATYSLYIHFSLLFFFMLLPFSLIEFFGYLTIPTVIIIGMVFFLIEKMAIHLQDPFENKPTDTPMTAISFTIERDLKQVINEPHIISQPVIRAKAYYVL